MGALQKFERRLESAISGVFARAFRSAVQPVEISAALQREVDNNTQILSRDRRLVPNTFYVELAQTDLDRLAPYDSAMASDMIGQLERHAMQQSYQFPGPVRIHFGSAEDLTTGRFRVRSEAQAGVISTEGPGTLARETLAFLEINGTRHPLRPPGLVVGRGTEAQLRITDPGVSRQHAEFNIVRAGGQVRIAVRDLGSTNGLTVDGQRTTAAPLRDGSTVVIGKTTLRVVLTDAVDEAPEDGADV